MERTRGGTKKENGEGNPAVVDFAEIFSRLTYWYGLDYFTIRKMPMSAIHHYLEQLERRQAEYRMMLGEAASVPHYDEETRGKWHDSITAYMPRETKKAEVTTPTKLASIGVKVKIVRNNE